MYKIICKNCNKEFEWKNKQKSFCSVKCRENGHKTYYPNTYNKKCKYCKKYFTSRSLKAIYCSQSCNSKSFKMRNKKEYEHKCLYCKKYFISKLKKTKYCSANCVGKAKNKKGTGKIISCPSCGKMFKQKHNKHKYCSPKCREKTNREHYKINVPCSNCGKKIKRLKSLVGNRKNFFCSRRCESSFREKEANDIRKCEFCGKKIFCKKGDKLRFCSIECQGKWQSKTRIGKNSSNYHKDVPEEMRTKKCEFCEKKIVGTPLGIKNKKFCSRRCMLRGAKFSMTTPHVMVCNILNKNNIEHSIEEQFHRYSFDCFIFDKKLAIEIMGTFYHCDPRRYKKPINEIQKNGIRRDKNKEKISKLENISILYLWEYDIINNINLCEKLILKFIQKNGILNNYHSMNYSVTKNRVKINDKILVPQFERK